MSLRCVLGHRWRLCGTEPYTDTSWGFRVPQTVLVLTCTRCGRWRDQIVDGTWTAAQLAVPDA